METSIRACDRHYARCWRPAARRAVGEARAARGEAAPAAARSGDALYRALGGEAGITRVVDAALAEIHGDLRIKSSSKRPTWRICAGL